MFYALELVFYFGFDFALAKASTIERVLTPWFVCSLLLTVWPLQIIYFSLVHQWLLIPL